MDPEQQVLKRLLYDMAGGKRQDPNITTSSPELFIKRVNAGRRSLAGCQRDTNFSRAICPEQGLRYCRV